MPDHRVPDLSATGRPLIATLTLGCKLNQAESQAWARQLEEAGCDVITRPAPAHGYIINTCSVTHVADSKARRLVRMAKRLAPGAPVVVTGCYADWAGENLATGADVVLPNADKSRAAPSCWRRCHRALTRPA
jgi:threonylcarbamoyladenosine tRNA methylthiotransferase MtaB